MTDALVTLRNRDTGETRTIEDEVFDTERPLDIIESCLVWQWTEGNYGCQCNRMLLGWEIDDVECADDGGIIELVSIVFDGRTIYPEKEEA